MALVGNVNTFATAALSYWMMVLEREGERKWVKNEKTGTLQMNFESEYFLSPPRSKLRSRVPDGCGCVAT
jgi:hypothetical protein